MQIQAQSKDSIPHHIKLDIDECLESYISLFNDIAKKLDNLDRIIGYIVLSCRVESNKRNSHNLHIFLKFNNDIPDISIPFIQLYLGSHDIRELYNLKRLLNGNNQNILFSIKMEVINHDITITSEYEYNEALTNQLTKAINVYQ